MGVGVREGVGFCYNIRGLYTKQNQIDIFMKRLLCAFETSVQGRYIREGFDTAE